MILEQFEELGLSNFSYLFGDEKSGVVAAVDPTPSSVEKMKTQIERRRLTLKYIFVTHTHFDHTGGIKPLLIHNPQAEVIVHKLEAGTLKRLGIRVGMEVDDKELIKVGHLGVKIIHTPGHTPGGICLLVQNKILFTGDTIFVGKWGRTDLPGGNPQALFRSITRKLKVLPGHVRIYPGHNYGNKKFSTIAEEKNNNPAFKASNFAEFEALG